MHHFQTHTHKPKRSQAYDAGNKYNTALASLEMENLVLTFPLMLATGKDKITVYIYKDKKRGNRKNKTNVSLFFLICILSITECQSIGVLY